MNIWAMEKHDTIRLLLFELVSHLNNGLSIDVVSDSDFYGVMFYKADQPEIKAYVHVHGQSENRYGIHVEYPVFKEHAVSDQLQIYENQSLGQILGILEIHFEMITDKSVCY